MRLPERLCSVKRHKVFSEFSKKYIPLTKVYYSIDELRNDPPKADMYLAGSDQIWNPTFKNGTDPAYYLDFGSKNVLRKSFAASFAVSCIEDVQKKSWIKDHLKRFDKITVREQSALKILKDMGYEGELQDDPVFMLNKEEWNRVLDLDESWKELGIKDEKYVLIYDFFLSDEIKSAALEYKKRNNCKIFSVCHKNLSYADKNFIYATPIDFVNLIKHASCVISNSFHGTCFAMIYNVPYTVVNRPDGLNVRMQDLLERR